jgi:uncharacterized membrane protein
VELPPLLHVPTVIAAISTAAANKKIMTAILGSFSVVRGGFHQQSVRLNDTQRNF